MLQKRLLKRHVGIGSVKPERLSTDLLKTDLLIKALECRIVERSSKS